MHFKRAITVTATVWATVLLTGQPPSAAPNKVCAAPAYRAFDFWLGAWNVFNPAGKKVGENRIEAALDGCALIEHWTGASGTVGTSLNAFDATDGRWHQTWVDSGGNRLELAGGIEGTSMVMRGTSPNAANVSRRDAQRITWSRGADGSVRQLWESSSDGGEHWSVAFDGRYVRKTSGET